MLNAPITYGLIHENLSDFLSDKNYSKIAVLVDENTHAYCYPFLPDSTYHLIKIESGEKNKNLETCSFIWEQLLNYRFTRHDLLINLGGGVISDMGAFAATCYKRGLDYINIPTTLLAMVDATVGGKTGIDFMQQKNMIGLFAAPKHIFIDENLLKSLPNRQINNGKAEMLKHGLIANEFHFNSVCNQDISLQLIIDSITIKLQIVAHDPYEKGMRKALNFGHTLGHAYESYALENDLNVLHGEAIAQGMIWAIKLSIAYCGFSNEKANKLIELIQHQYGIIELNEELLNSLLEIAANDKKNVDSNFSFTLLKDIGKPQVDVMLTKTQIIEALSQ